MEYPVYCEGRLCGTMYISRVGGDTCFELTGKEKGIFRAWVEGESGELQLGIMENGCLRRRFSPRMTCAIGRTICARLECLSQSASAWRCVRKGEFPMWKLPENACCRKKGRQCELALPYGEGEPFPLLPLFCFARICMMKGRRWAVFLFDDEGHPIMVK